MGRKSRAKRERRQQKWASRGFIPEVPKSRARPPPSPQQLESWSETLDYLYQSLRKGIPDRLKALQSMVARFDPIILLEYVSMQNVVFDPTTYEEPMAEGQVAFAEYALNLVSGAPKRGSDVPTMEDLEAFGQALRELFLEVMLFAGFKAGDHRKPTPLSELRAQQLHYFMVVRMEWVPQHQKEHVLDLLSPHDEALKAAIGVDAQALLQFQDACDERFHETFAAQKKAMDAIAMAHQAFVQRLEAAETTEDQKEALAAYLASPEHKTAQAEVEDAKADGAELGLFELVPGPLSPQNLLDSLSMELGQNHEFYAHGGPWPINDSATWLKPIVRHDGRYFMFVPSLLQEGLVPIAEYALEASDPDYWRISYLPARGQFLEDKCLDYLTAIHPSATVYRSLKYRLPDEPDKLYETDGLVLFDDVALIVEAKSGAFHLQGRRGSPEHLETDIKHLVAEPLAQGRRVRSYLEDNAEARFSVPDVGDVEIDGTAIREFHIITPTLSPLGPVTARLPVLRDLGWLDGNDWPWSIFIGNLRIISELVEGPSELLLYLRRRAEANDNPKAVTADELDWFMEFLQTGLYFDEGVPPDVSRLFIASRTVPLDSYYMAEAGLREAAPKPRFNVAEGVRELLRELDSSNVPGGIVAAAMIASFDDVTQRRTAQFVNDLRAAMASDGSPHNRSMVFNDAKMGLTLWIYPKVGEAEMAEASAHAETKLLKQEANEWVTIVLDGKEIHAARRFMSDPGLEARVAGRGISFGRGKQIRIAKAESKLRRNDLCHCGSGIKYKRCHLRK